MCGKQVCVIERLGSGRRCVQQQGASIRAVCTVLLDSWCQGLSIACKLFCSEAECVPHVYMLSSHFVAREGEKKNIAHHDNRNILCFFFAANFMSG